MTIYKVTYNSDSEHTGLRLFSTFEKAEESLGEGWVQYSTDYYDGVKQWLYKDSGNVFGMEFKAKIEEVEVK